MSLTLRWMRQCDDEGIIRSRWYSFGYGAQDRQRFAEAWPTNPHTASGDVVLAEQDGQAVGSATAIPLTMWVRSSPFPCQGVADVGTILTRRRSGGVATRIMNAVLDHARQTGQVLSALMPFRASYYEHFGYGLVERRCAWTVPLSLMPEPAGDVMEMFDDADLPALCACRQRIAEAGQCDIERSRQFWEFHLKRMGDSFVVVDRDPATPAAGGAVRGYLIFSCKPDNVPSIVRVGEIGYQDTPGLLRLLRFLGTLRDQHSAVTMTLPGDVDLNWLLREKQLTGGTGNHPTVQARPYSHMQVRILDNRRLIESLHLPPEASGRAVVAIHHAEGNTTRLLLEIAAGHAQAADTSADADIECTDPVWAAVALGHMPASRAAKMGLVKTHNSLALKTLDALAVGPTPFTWEGF